MEGPTAPVPQEWSEGDPQEGGPKKEIPEGDPWVREEDARVPQAGSTGKAKRTSQLEAMNMERWEKIFSGGGKLSFLVDNQATAIRYIVRNFPDVEIVGPDGLTLPECFVLIWQNEDGKLAEYSFFGADEPFHNALFGAALIGLRARGLLDFQERDGQYLGKYYLPILSGEAPQDEVLKAVYDELASQPKNSLKMWFEEKSGKWGQDETTQLTIKSLINRGILEDGSEGDMFGNARYFPKDLSLRKDIIERIRKVAAGEVPAEEDKRSTALLALCRSADLRDSTKNLLMKRIFGKEGLEDWISKVDDVIHDLLPPPTISTEEIDKMLGRLPKDTRAHLISDAFQVECKEKFNKLDVSGSGALEPSELSAAINECLPVQYVNAMQMDEESTADVVLMFDSNQNGKIELSEFTEFLKWAMGMKVLEYFNAKKC